MESLSRSTHRSKLPTATSASSSSSSFSLKNPYDDILFSDGVNVEFGAHEYAEIFSGSPSSIPVLDLSGLNERIGSGDSRSSKLDYPSIFSGLRDGEAAAPFEELLSGAPKKNETWNPAHVQLPDEESISRKTKMPSGDPPDPLPTDETDQHFSISFSKTSPTTIGDLPNGETHIAQLHAVPSFTYFVDGSPRKAKKEAERHCSSSPKREVSRTWSFSTVGSEEDIPAKDGSSIPEKSRVKSHDSSDIRNVSERLPPVFDEESDENSLAALSAAALKKAVEQAEESIRIAKTIMERKKEHFVDGCLGNRSKGLMSKERKKIRLENGAEKVRENVRVVIDGLNKRVDSRNVGQKVKANNSCARGETIVRMEAGDDVDNNKGKFEKEFVAEEEVVCDKHLKQFSGDLWNKSGSPVEEYVVEQEDGGNDYKCAPDMKTDGSCGKNAQDEIRKRVDDVREVETDEKKPHFRHDGETLCKEFRQNIQMEENNFSEGQNNEISRAGEETDYIFYGNHDTFEFQGNDEAADSSCNNNSGFNETRSNDNMTLYSESREQSDVDSNNEAEEYQDDGPSGSKTENGGLMNGHHEHGKTFADQTNEKDGHLENKEEPLLVHELQESEENENATSSKEELKNVMEQSETDNNLEKNKEISKEQKDSKANEQKFEMEYQQQRIEAIKRGREREKDRIVVERAIREARERAFAEARERAERERAARERGQAAEDQEKPADKASAAEAKIRAARAVVERALEKARSQKTSAATRAQAERCPTERSSNSSSNGLKHSFSSSDLEKVDGNGSESTQRRNMRLERHQQTMERAAKALEEKNMRDFLAEREQADRNRLAESLDADIKIWVRGKEGNLRALLSTLQYIVGPDSGWQPVSLTEIITTAAVKKTYRKATLCVHPDKLQQRGANIQQKYICEKVFDLLKAAWNMFNSEER